MTLPPSADERTEPLVTTWQAKVRHLAAFPGSRNRNPRTACGQSGFFLPGRADLPLCAECERRVSRRHPERITTSPNPNHNTESEST